MSASVYKYKAYSLAGDRIDGEVVASSMEEAERRILSKDLTVLSIQPAGKGSASTEKPIARKSCKKISDGDTALILKNLSMMISVGVPFIEAVEGVSQGLAPNVQMLMDRFKAEVVEGKSVSVAMRATPELFPAMVADMVRVAEEGAQLEKALGNAATHLERTAEFRKKVLQAMLYPAVMVSVSFMTVVILLIFVMPRFSKIFTQLNVKLPLTTKLLLSFGDLVRLHTMGVGITIVLLIVTLRYLLSIPAAKQLAMVFIMKTPMIGSLLNRLAVSRALSSIATLLAGNVPVIAALQQGAAVAGNAEISHALITAKADLENGGNLFTSLSKCRAFPSQVLQMVAVGERTGRLPALLAGCATQMEHEADASLKSLVGLVEPLMIVVMGAFVGMITVSIITPIYSVVENIK